MGDLPGRVGVKTIAEKCGVSIGSVDRALHDRSGISKETRRKILDKADELGYRPHLGARSLVTGKSSTVGVVVFDLNIPFTAQLVSAAIARLRVAGYFCTVTVSEGDRNEEKRCLEQLGSLNVDGIIMVPINKGRRFSEYLESLNLPIVTVINFLSKTWPYVGVDYRQAAADAVEYAVSRGYKRVVYLCPPYPRTSRENSHAVTNLIRGYRDAVKKINGLAEPLVISGDSYIPEVEQLRFGKTRKTAILCSSDVYALELLTYLGRKGFHIPDDVGLMGFDNISTLRYVYPPPATIDCSVTEIGTRAAECLLSEFKGEYVSPVVKHKIVPGETL